MSHPLIALAVIVLPPTALYTLARTIRRAYLRSRLHVRLVADRGWREWEREQAEDDAASAAHERAVHDRVMAGYWRAMLLAPQRQTGDPRGALLATQAAVAQAIAARLDADAAKAPEGGAA